MTIQGRGAFLVSVVPLGLLGGLVLFAVYGWQQEHYARLNAETQTGEQQKQIDGLKEQEAEAQQVLDKKLASLEQERKRPATAAELVSATSSLLPDLPAPLQVVTVPSDPALPDIPPKQEVVIPEADFKGIRDAQIDCQEDSAKLAACLSTQQDTTRQLKLTEAQRDEWKTAAKGGSMWHRALGAAKWFAIGAGAGAAAYAVDHHR